MRPLALLLALALCVSSALADKKPRGRFEKWLDEVEYLITPEEVKEWKLLASDAERLDYVEKFWKLRTPEGGDWESVKSEHYRRIQYSDQRFSAGYRGSKTDRGRIYIQLGPPDTLSRMTPGPRRDFKERDRALLEIYGQNFALGQDKPAELWTYRHVPGTIAATSEVKFLFIDRNFSGVYELSYDFGDVDRLNLLDADPVLAAERGALGTSIIGGFDVIGIQKELRRDIERRRQLASDVTQSISFERLAIAPSRAFFRGPSGQTFVAVAVDFPVRELGFEPMPGGHRAQLELEGRVLGEDGVARTSFQGAAQVELDAAEWPRRMELTQQIQAGVLLDPGNYSLELVLLDRRSSRVGVAQEALQVPLYPEGSTSMSSVLLASRMDRAKPEAQGAPQVDLGHLGELGKTSVALTRHEQQGPFQFGGLEVTPLGAGVVKRGEPVGVYVQIYDPGLRPVCACPDLLVDYSLRREGRLIKRLGESKRLENPVSGGSPMVSAGRMAELGALEPGRYTLVVSVEDRVRGKSLSGEASFTIR